MESCPRGVLYLDAFFYLERAGQKKIVIGHNGERLKAIKANARREIEEYLGRRVFLELRVKVRESGAWIRRAWATRKIWDEAHSVAQDG